MGDYNSSSPFFVYEADEFDRNFLAYSPSLSLISGVSWDHHEIYPTRENYKQAFVDFINKSQATIIWQNDVDYLGLSSPKTEVQRTDNPGIGQLKLKGLYNRYDAWLAAQAFKKVSDQPIDKILEAINKFPGLSRRMEEIYPGLYSDYAHTPEKIRAAVSAALETAKDKNQSVVVVYEPLTNRRQVHMLEGYKDCFKGVTRLYWLPSYLAREDPEERTIEPQELIDNLEDPSIAQVAERGDSLRAKIAEHLSAGDMVVGMAGGGGDSLDDWLRDQFKS
jgi:UDP-N-acetylmuramate--alanine ligase